VNKTGLMDKKFDFELKWTPDGQNIGNTDGDIAASISAALEAQLGLKLIPAKANMTSNMTPSEAEMSPELN
jgi:uncharacterized protein (TIGR03435 family)